MWDMALRRRNTTALPVPQVVPTTGKFEGNDGKWSTFWAGLRYELYQTSNLLTDVRRSTPATVRISGHSYPLHSQSRPYHIRLDVAVAIHPIVLQDEVSSDSMVLEALVTSLLAKAPA
jgi:hypothetical protein